MSKTKGTGFGKIIKSLVITTFRLLAIVIAFTCKIVGLVITKLGEIFEKLSGHEDH